MYKVKCRDTEMHIMLHKHMWHNLREGKFSEFSRLENWYHTVLSDLPEKKNHAYPLLVWANRRSCQLNSKCLTLMAQCSGQEAYGESTCMKHGKIVFCMTLPLLRPYHASHI